MKKNILLSLFLSLIAIAAQAQFTITGQVVDTAKAALPSVTVMLLNPKDSTLANYTSTDSKGNFAFKNIRKTGYILKTSHISFMPREILITPTEEKEISLGAIEMKPIANFLMEIVIKEARAPIFIKGDTVEYDASTFKVPPGSTVEDLLRKLPGLDVDAEGNISTQGKNVRTVYVDGKNFFGNDPKTVTQNLDAAAISKVQVYTEKSEQEKLTGISDGSKEKAMNLELKDEYKKGYFGKASLGSGWGAPNNWLWLGKGSFNWFSDKQQLSFIGYGNNLNQSNLDWSEMQEFRGQSFQSREDNGDFGFNSGARGGFSSMFSYSSSGSGFSNNGGAGVNYNYFDKKIKLNAGYLYTLNETFSDVFTEKLTLEPSFWLIDTACNRNFRQNHNFSTRLEYQIDSLNKIILRATLGFIPLKRTYTSNQLFLTPEMINLKLNTIDNNYENNNLSFDFLTIYNHKFKKKGRSFSWSGFYYIKDGDNMDNINNVDINAISPQEQIKYWVRNNKNTEDHTVKSSLLYVEPLGKRFSILGFYNFRNNLSYNNNNSVDQNNNTPIDSLWLDYKNNTLYNRVGTSLDYTHNGINFTVGGGFQSIILQGTSKTKTLPLETLKPTRYNNFIPYFSTWFQLPKNVYLQASYSYAVSEPDISYLFPMPNYTNKSYITLGNPNLTPEKSHDLSARVNYWDQASMVSFSFNADAKFFESQIVYNQIIDTLSYVTTSTPDNVKGGNRYSSWIWTSIPIVKTILSVNINLSGGLSNSPVFINGEENITNSKNYRAGIHFNINVSQKLSFTAGGNISQTFTAYSIQNERDQDYLSAGGNASVKWQFLKKTYLESSYRFSKNTNKKLDFDRDIHNLNVSVRQVIGKKNQWEMRLAAVDLLNQNQYINQYAAANYIEIRTAPTLARYFFLTVSYNLKGFEVKNTENQRARVMRR